MCVRAAGVWRGAGHSQGVISYDCASTRPEEHLTRIALAEIEGSKRSVRHLLWLMQIKPALGLLNKADVDVDNGLGGSILGLRAVRTSVSKVLHAAPAQPTPLIAATPHTLYTCTRKA